jgi:tetratricopeptide (TPR) repeat protein
LIENDYDRAIAVAKDRHALLFVDAWAAWCPPCLTFRERGLTDARLQPYAASFVFATIDTELVANHAFLMQHAMKSWPTFWIIDPETHEMLAQKVGSEVAPVLKMMDRVLAQRGARSREITAAATSMESGDSAFAGGDYPGAVLAYRHALDAAENDQESEKALVGVLSASFRAKQYQSCIDAATTKRLEKVTDGGRAALGILGLVCARELPYSEGGATAQRFLGEVETMALDPKLHLTIDERAHLFTAAADADPKFATSWADWLETVVAAETTTSGRRIWLRPLTDAYVAANRLSRAYKALDVAQREDPSDYLAPYLVSLVAAKENKWARAIEALDLALAHSAGTFRITILQAKANALKHLGRVSQARQVLKQALTELEPFRSVGVGWFQGWSDSLTKQIAEIGQQGP